MSCHQTGGSCEEKSTVGRVAELIKEECHCWWDACVFINWAISSLEPRGLLLESHGQCGHYINKINTVYEYVEKKKLFRYKWPKLP